MFKPGGIVVSTILFTYVVFGGGCSSKSSIEHGLLKGDEVVVLEDSTVTQEDGSTIAVTKGTKLTISKVDKDKIWTSIISPSLLDGHEGVAKAAVFSPDGSIVASCGGVVGGPGQAILWDADTEEKLDGLNVEDGLDYASDIAFDPTGTRIAVSTYPDKRIVVWDAETRRTSQILTLSEKHPARFDISPDGSLIAVAESGYFSDRSKRRYGPCDVSVWNLDTGQRIFALKGMRQDGISVSFSTDGKMIAGGGKDGSIYLWDLSNGQLMKSWPTGSSVGELTFLPSNKSIASCSDAGDVKIWEVPSGRLEKTLSFFGIGRSIACSENGDLIACGDRDGKIRLWTLDSGELKIEIEAHDTSIQGLSFSKDGTKLVSASHDSSVRIFNIRSGWMSAANLLKVND